MDTHEAYSELGLDPNVTDSQLKAAWRRLVSTWHPDRNRTTEAAVRIQRINKAYHLIRHDRGSEVDSRDVAPSPEKNAQPAADRRVYARTVSLSIEEAVLGCVRSLSGSFDYECRTCDGKGQRILAEACKGCRGSGAVQRAALFGWFWFKEACEDCGGDGRLRVPCTHCEGDGQVSVKYRRKVRFPAGVRQGEVLTIPGTRHDRVDLCLEIRVKFEPHPFFVLEDGVLRCEMPVDGYAWISNRWVDVPAPEGLQQMRLNRNALAYRLRGQGFPVERGGPRGDYLVKVVPTFPDDGDAEQQLLIDRLIEISAKAADADKNSQLTQWRRRLKSWDPDVRAEAEED